MIKSSSTSCLWIILRHCWGQSLLAKAGGLLSLCRLVSPMFRIISMIPTILFKHVSPAWFQSYFSNIVFLKKSAYITNMIWILVLTADISITFNNITSIIWILIFHKIDISISIHLSIYIVLTDMCILVLSSSQWFWCPCKKLYHWNSGLNLPVRTPSFIFQCC